MGIIDSLGELGIIPVVRIEEGEQACKLADALTAAVLPCAEVTFRTKNAVLPPQRSHSSHSRGLKVLKFFPAQAMGGIDHLRVISPA